MHDLPLCPRPEQSAEAVRLCPGSWRALYPPTLSEPLGTRPQAISPTLGNRDEWLPAFSCISPTIISVGHHADEACLRLQRVFPSTPCACPQAQRVFAGARHMIRRSATPFEEQSQSI